MAAKSAKPSKAGSSSERIGEFAESLPVTEAMAVGELPLPEAKAPAGRISVSVPKPDDLDASELAARFQELARAQATTRSRQLGEQLQEGDDVQLDILGYCNGKLIPFSARIGVWMELSPLPHLPGFAEGLVGEKVGDSFKIDLTLPPDYPVEALRMAPASFMVDVKAAREVKLPDEESPEFLAKLGKGATLDEVMAAIASELEEELSDLLWVEAQDRVLDEVAQQTQVEVPQALVDEEIRRRWGHAEGKALLEKGFTAEEQQEALQGWLEDPATRAEAQRRLRISLGLKAIAERDKLELTAGKVAELVEDVAAQIGLTQEQVRESIKGDRQAKAQLNKVAWHLMVVGHVMEQAQIHFEGAED